MVDILTLPPDAGRDALDRVHDGAILIFKDVPQMHALIRLTDARLRAAFGDNPPAAVRNLAPDDAAETVDGLQKVYRKDPEIRAAFSGLLAALGCDPDDTHCDAFHLRCLAPGGGHTARQTRPLGAHRDSWASNIYAQRNWWAPLYPIVPERGLMILQRYWARPIANSSADWEFAKAKAARAADTGRGSGAAAYPMIPQPTEEVDTTDALRLAVEPGDVLSFSGAQLHASVPNETALARFSIETRTVSARDLREGRSAPNVDGAAKETQWAWFRRLTDRAPLTPEAATA
ncbi:MAG: hypothetical protein QNJ92_14310 [Alphaproteobacteria bacterium]|nr:hypothetical protein [Alphaproteobacteria bacterium]